MLEPGTQPPEFTRAARRPHLSDLRRVAAASLRSTPTSLLAHDRNRTATPDFTLPDQDSKPGMLSDFRGRPVVLYFYPKADTPGR